MNERELIAAADLAKTRERQKKREERAEKQKIRDSITQTHTANAEELLAQARRAFTTNAILEARHLVSLWVIKNRHVITDPKTNRLYVYDDRKGHYVKTGEEMIRSDIANALGVDATKGVMSEVLSKVRALSYRNEEELINTTPPNLIPCKNGIYDISTQTLSPHTPERFFTFTHPHNYDTHAVCRKTIMFLESILPSEREREIILDLVACTLYRARITRHFYIFVGSGHNGKGALLRLIRALLGEDRVSSVSPQALASDLFAGAQLIDKNANLGGDITGQELTNIQIIKESTGDDKVSLQRKGIDRTEEKIYCEFVWSSNDPPRIKEDNYGLWDRLVVIQFPHRFVKEPTLDFERNADPHIEKEINTPSELEGLLALTVTRLPRLLQERTLSVTLDPEATRREYRTLSDTPSVFLSEVCEEVEYEPGEKGNPSSGWSACSEVYRAYREWCKKSKLVPVSANKLGRTFKALGVDKGRDGDTTSYRGIKVHFDFTDFTDLPQSLPRNQKIKNDNLEGAISEIDEIDEIKRRKNTSTDLVVHWVRKQGKVRISDFLEAWPDENLERLITNGDLMESPVGWLRCP